MNALQNLPQTTDQTPPTDIYWDQSYKSPNSSRSSTTPQSLKSLESLISLPSFAYIFHPYQDRVPSEQAKHSPDIVRCTCGLYFPTTSIRIFILGAINNTEQEIPSRTPSQ